MVFGKERLTVILVNAVTIFKVNEGIHSIHVVHESRGVSAVTQRLIVPKTCVYLTLITHKYIMELKQRKS